MATTISIRTTDTQPFILLPTCVNGEGPFDFVLDTGAAMSILTRELADRLGVDGTEIKEGLGAAGQRIEVPLATVGSLSVRGIELHDLRVGITTALPKCVGAHGALGNDFLAELIVTVDYARGMLTLASPQDGIDRLRTADVPLRLASPDRPVLLVDVGIGARESYQFILDTGASHTVVSPELAQRIGAGGPPTDAVVGVGGAVRTSIATLPSLSIGAAVLSDVAVVVANMFTTLSQAVGVTLDGVLGYNVLSRFTVEIDVPAHTLRLLGRGKPNAEQEGRAV